MSCIINIPFSGDAANIISMAKSAVQRANGQFAGDVTGGSFSVSIAVGKIQADYTIHGQQLEINVTKKPLLVPCKRIESFLQEQLNGQTR